jgi:hypothetical protein
LNAVFPEGIRWDRFDGGPIQRRVFQDLLPDPQVLERRVDRLASTIFGALFVLLASLVAGLLWVLLLVVVGAAAVRLVAPDADPVRVFWVLLVLWLLPLVLANAADRRFKRDPAKLKSSPRLAAAVERTLRGYQHAFGGRFYNSIFLVFSTHYSTRRATVATVIITTGLAAFFLSYFLVRLGLFGFDSYQYFPTRPGPLLVRADHYEDVRGSSSARTSTIQSEVVDGPYVRLFIPFLVNRDRLLIEERCPEVEPLRRDGLFLAARRRGTAEQVAEVTACLRRIYEVRLNGQSVDLSDLGFHRRPADGVAGIVVHLATAGMPNGRNLIEVRRVPLAADRGPSDTAVENERRAEYLPFWR